MANNQRGRSRPSYMLIFGELLARFNEAQPKYAPGQRRITPPQGKNLPPSIATKQITTTTTANTIRARASPATVPAPSSAPTQAAQAAAVAAASAATSTSSGETSAQSAPSSGRRSSSARTSSGNSAGGAGGQASLSPAKSETSIRLTNKTGVSVPGNQQFREFSPRDLSTGALGPILDQVKHPASERFNHQSRINWQNSPAEPQQQQQQEAPLKPQSLAQRAAERSSSRSTSRRETTTTTPPPPAPPPPSSTSTSSSTILRDENQLTPEIIAQIQLQRLLAKTRLDRDELQGTASAQAQAAAAIGASSESSMGQKAVGQSRAPAAGGGGGGAQVAPTRSPATRPATQVARSPKLPAAMKNTKESGTTPRLSQTPAANIGVGGSGSFETRAIKNLGKVSSPVGHKKVSLSKIIAEQTPDAFQTLGPGFHITAPGERSTPKANETGGTGGGKKSGPLDSVPSDYEHIFHYPSGLAEDPQVNANKATTNANRKHHGKHHGKHQQDNNKAANNKKT